MQRDAVTYLDICSHVPKAKAVLFAGDAKHPNRDVYARLRDRTDVPRDRVRGRIVRARARVDVGQDPARIADDIGQQDAGPAAGPRRDSDGVRDDFARLHAAVAIGVALCLRDLEARADET